MPRPVVTITLGTLASGPRVTQYGRPATCTLLAPAELGQPQNYGRPHGWDDATVPRTDRPAYFIPRTENAALLARAGFDPQSFVLRF